MNYAPVTTTPVDGVITIPVAVSPESTSRVPDRLSSDPVATTPVATSSTTDGFAKSSAEHDAVEASTSRVCVLDYY